MKILYAEDEELLSKAITEILEIQGYQVDNAYDGEQALNLASQNYYDACVLDIMMPKMSGIEVLNKMRTNGNFTPVLMLTAKSTTEDKIEGLDTGADDYITKPFDTEEFLARLKSLVRRSSQKYQQNTVCFGNVELNCQTNELKGGNGSLMLSSKESALLRAILTNAPAKLKIEHANEAILSEQDAKDTRIKLYTKYLMDKLSLVAADFSLLLTSTEIIINTANAKEE